MIPSLSILMAFMQAKSCTLSQDSQTSLGLKYLGGGMYGCAYEQADGSVLKVGATADGTMDYIEWCYRRLLKFGKGSISMACLPEVEAFGLLRKAEDLDKQDRPRRALEEHGPLWWAVMPRYLGSQSHREGFDAALAEALGHARGNQYEATKDYVKRLLKETLLATSGGSYLGWDLHSGNVMMDPVRRMWVVTDPLSDPSTGTGSSAEQPRLTPRRLPEYVRPRKATVPSKAA